jgi:hypothetical protein
MGISVRSYLLAGVSVLAAAVIAIPTSVPAAMPTPAQAHPTDVRVERVDLAASVRSLVTTTPNPEHFAAATAAMARIDPAAMAAAAAPVPLNAASDWIVSAYQFIQPWVTYGVQVADYVLGFIPFGYLIADQVNIVYYNLVVPISDSIVYGLVVPVVNDPLNLASYVNGLVAVGQASIKALINFGIAEFNNFFGWLIPPLPPLPLAAARTGSPVEATTLAAGLDPAITPDAEAKDAPASTPEVKRPKVKKIVDVPPAAAETAATETTPPKTTADDEVKGEVRGAAHEAQSGTTTTATKKAPERKHASSGGVDTATKTTKTSDPDTKGADKSAHKGDKGDKGNKGDKG